MIHLGFVILGCSNYEERRLRQFAAHESLPIINFSISERSTNFFAFRMFAAVFSAAVRRVICPYSVTVKP